MSAALHHHMGMHKLQVKSSQDSLQHIHIHIGDVYNDSLHI